MEVFKINFCCFVTIFAARCYASAALAVMRCPSVCLPVCLSRSYILSKRINISSIFSPSGSHTVLISPYQTLWQYSDGSPLPLHGASNACGVGKNRESDPITRFIACCERCDGQLVSTRFPADTRLSTDACWS